MAEPSATSTVPSQQPISVLFVCLGNICRSTMAEGVFRSLTSKPPYKDLVKVVDSSGTGAYHVGNSPDSRTMSTLKGYGIADYIHSARKVHIGDFETFDYIFAMDKSNMYDLQRLKGKLPSGGKAKVMLFGEYGGGKKAEEIDDPYYGGKEGFDIAYQQCMRFSKNFLNHVFPDIKS